VAEKVIAKAVVHIHSAWSYDGNWELPRIADLFGRRGYDVVLTAEHDRTFNEQRWEDYKKACREASTARTLIVPGIEYSDETNTIHVLVWGVPVFLGNNQPTGDLLRKATGKNGICVLAHPSRCEAWKKLDSSWLPLFHGIELWNRKFDGIAPSREASGLLKVPGTSTAFVGLDFHRINQLFPLTMMIQINGTLSAENVFTALRTGNSCPLALGISALRFTGGFLSPVAAAADRIRRLIAKSIKE
jgi:hypothetical protein